MELYLVLDLEEGAVLLLLLKLNIVHLEGANIRRLPFGVRDGSHSTS